MERTVTIHAVNIVTTETVTDITEVVWRVVPTGFMVKGAIKVKAKKAKKKAWKHSQISIHCFGWLKIRKYYKQHLTVYLSLPYVGINRVLNYEWQDAIISKYFPNLLVLLHRIKIKNFINYTLILWFS